MQGSQQYCQFSDVNIQILYDKNVNVSVYKMVSRNKSLKIFRLFFTRIKIYAF